MENKKVNVSHEAHTEGLALDSISAHHNGNALEQKMVAAAYQQFRKESLNKDWMFKYLSNDQQIALRKKFDEEYAKKMREVYSPRTRLNK